jgi:hypothetical protein
MAQRVEPPMQAGLAIHELVVEAHGEDKRDRRSVVRYPFFRPLSIRMDGHCYSALSREISTAGIGLLHNFELATREVEIDIRSSRGHLIRVRTRIIWCHACGEGWYVSGGQFLGLIGIVK